jgi:tetratricopeptide (TPR) repeat protein
MRLPFSVDSRAGSVSDGKTGETLVLSCRRLRFRLVSLFILVGLTVGAFIVGWPPMRAWYHRRQARAELQHYHTPQAIRHLLICRAIWPRDPETLLMAARAARRAKLYSDSERLLHDYRQVRGRDEAYSFEQILLAAECCIDEMANLCWQYVEEGRFDTALLLEALTQGYLQQYQLSQAQHCLKRWQQIQPDNPQIFYLKGLFKLDYLHDRAGGEEDYRHALELDADHEEARLGLAVALLLGKSFAQAAEHFKHLRQCQPDNWYVQVQLAECLDSLGQTAEAVRLVDEVLARQPQYGPALSLRGRLALRSGQLDKAESWLRQALCRNPMDHHAHYSLILCLEESGQHEESQRQQRQFQRMEEDLSRFNDIVTKEIAQRPNDPALHCTLGQILLRSGHRAKGLRWLQSALRLDPYYAPARQAIEEYQKSEPQP